MRLLGVRVQDRVRNDSTREMKKIPNVDEIIMEGDGNGLYMSAQPRGKSFVIYQPLWTS